MGKGRALAIEIAAREKEPIFLALARAIIEEIERGRLRPGSALPGTRSLAKNLKLNRNTVDAAYHELTMQGWLTAKPSRGTFVAEDLPDISKAATAENTISRSFAQMQTIPPVLCRLSDGAPDVRLLPATAFAQAFRRALISVSFTHNNTYGDPAGNPSLRENLAAYLNNERGIVATKQDILITRGSQMALFLAAKAITQSGSGLSASIAGTKIAVEKPGYRLAWAAFQAAGAQIAPVAVDENGIDTDALEAMAAADKDLKAVYLTPHHQYPTTVTLGAARRLRLLDIARRYGLTIIEDDYDNEYRYDARPVLPLMAHAGEDITIIYLGSLSKLMAPGIRIGYVVAAPHILKLMTAHREAIDRQGDLPLELALGNLLADGTIKRHARKARRIYHARRDFLADLLKAGLGDISDFTLPAGGLAIWLRLAPHINAEDWAARAAQAGLNILSGRHFTPQGSRPAQAFRIGFASHNEAELSRAMQILVKTRP